MVHLTSICALKKDRRMKKRTRRKQGRRKVKRKSRWRKESAQSTPKEPIIMHQRDGLDEEEEGEKTKGKREFGGSETEERRENHVYFFLFHPNCYT